MLFANAVAHTLQPSFYDSVIQIKKLPYLPDFINEATVKYVFALCFSHCSILTVSHFPLPIMPINFATGFVGDKGRQ